MYGTTVHMTIGSGGSSSGLNPTMYDTTSTRRKTRGGTTYVADEEEEGDPDYEEEDDSDYEEEEEIPDEDDGSDAENNSATVDTKGFKDREDDLMVRNHPDENNSEDLADSIDNSGQENSISLSNEQKEAIDKLQSLLACTPPAADSDILESFSNVIFQVFTSQPSDTVLNHDYSPIEAYLLSRGIHDDGGFASSLRMSKTLSKVQYAGLYTVLHNCIKANQPLE